ncbi:MAG: DUF721 domain-containing protein [Nitrospinae bacterium]|nr:DUF721 domain-containing protein [Nitrospinota bacterium]
MISIKDALEGALGSVRLGTVASLVRITSNWERIVGPQLSGVCSPAYIWQKTLVVHVDDPAFLAPLDYSRMTILEKTKAVLGDETTVQSISVRYNEEKAVKKFGQKERVPAPAEEVSERDVEPLSAVKDPALKRALERLFKASLGSGKKLAAVAVAVGMAASCASAGKTSGSRMNTAQQAAPKTSDEKKAAKAETDEEVAKRAAKEKDATFYFLRAQMRMHENQFSEAMTDLRAILKLDPRFIEAYVEITKLSLALGKVEDAIETAQKGLAINPENPVLNSLLGVIYHNSKDYDRAGEFLKKSLAADPSREDVRLNLAFNYLEQKRPDDAERELLEILKKNPSSNIAMIYLAKAYVDSKAYVTAEEFLTRYTMQFPDVPQGYGALGWVYSVQGKYDLAVDVYKKYLEKYPHDAEMQHHLANAYLLKKSYGEALDVYKEIERETPGAADLEYKMGVIYFQQGQMREALEKFQLVRLAQPGNKTVPYYIARIDEELGMYKEALEEWGLMLKGAENDKERVEIYVKTAGVYEKMKDLDKAEESVVSAVRLKKDDPDLYYILGVIYAKKERYDAAADNVRQAIKMDPKREEFIFYLGVIYEKTKEYAKCVEQMKRVVEINPKHADALNYIGFLYADRNENLAQALAYVNKAMALDPDNGYYEDSLAWIYYRQQKYALALEEIQKSVGHLKEKDATIYDHMGDIQAALGNWQKAAEAYSISVELKQDTEVSRKLSAATSRAGGTKHEKITDGNNEHGGKASTPAPL